MNKLQSLTSLSCMLFMSCQSLSAASLSNFNEPNSQNLIQALQTKKIHIVQLGDSHTAADEMTNNMRLQLQSTLGNGGMGWGMPMYFTGHRLVRYGYDNSGWQPVSSRTRSDENYSLGGLLAIPQSTAASLTIKAKQSEVSQRYTVSIRQQAGDSPLIGQDAQGRPISIEAPIKNGTWQFVQFVAQPPFTIQSQQAKQTALGGWWGENERGQGAVVSALGINGAQLSYWNRWNTQAWQKELAAVSPNLLILAYGTNEAYNNNLDVAQTRQILIEKIQAIRSASPKTAVMIVSAPESLKNINGSCGVRPIKLDEVQQMQREVAQQYKTLYWDWQAAMGGNCSMKTWINRGDARRDGVHFSASGYQKLGNMLAADILNIANIQSSTVSPSYGLNTNTVADDLSPQGGVNIKTTTRPYATICKGNDCTPFP
ncbi:SGNH/GDSL hydrolase family protein [Acinetobacter rudis]|uniref:SGNH/GDSL hydrolase family protein n=1 Tax=Acinetobacter rudis TaxID=632955 RepID=A0AAW8JER1_9GAMM|nr:SGNH/GDSL hydrolase family protein [Acinetobacter rudis]MDQ8937090.1 SGNH/GDSL hydrolase family protein [Acinetobacter rudis]MDQ9019302.1 SGNH/GDSL hydrolase family protein [Acinetobacter rudis]